MSNKNELSFGLVLDKLYNLYLIIFLICLFGAILYELYECSKKHSKIQVCNSFVSSIVISFFLAAIMDTVLINLDITLKMLVCFSCGIFSKILTGILTNIKYIKIFLVIVFKRIKTNIGKVAVDTIEKIEEEKEKEKERNKKIKEEDE